MKLLPLLLAVAVAGMIAPVSVLPAAAAQAAAASAPTLPITYFRQLVLDPAHGHIFISQGGGSQSGILVTDFSGQPVTTIGSTGVLGIALSPDGSTLYAALATGDAVVAVDTATLTQTASYPMPAGDSAEDVAVQSGKVWVSFYAATAGNAGIGYFDPSVASPALQTPAVMSGWGEPPQLASDPKDTGVLVAIGTGTSGFGLASYDTTTDPVTPRAGSPNTSPNCGNEQDLAVAPGGAEFAIACQDGSAYDIRSTATLNELRSVGPSTPGIAPHAVAYDSAGDLAAGSAFAATEGDVYVYPPGGTSALNAFKLYSQSIGGGNLQPRGLAMLPDGSELFGVLQAGTQSRPYVLTSVANPAVTVTTLSLTAPATADITKPLSLAGSLIGSAGSPLPAGAPITITRTAGDGMTATFHATTAADGTFTLTDTPPALGTYTYQASYAGSATSTASTASQTVTVTTIPTSLTLTTPSAVLTYQPTFTVTANLGPTDTNRTVSIYAQPAGGTKTLLKTGTVDASGNLAVSYTAPQNTTFTAVFSGDADYAPATTTLQVFVNAKVSASVSGSYGKKKIGGITYRLFHHTKPVTIRTTVAPNEAGNCVTIEIQEFVSGTWQPNSVSNCGYLNSSSKATGLIDVSHADLKFHYRIRIDCADDTTNGAGSSPWQYVIVNK